MQRNAVSEVSGQLLNLTWAHERSFHTIQFWYSRDYASI